MQLYASVEVFPTRLLNVWWEGLLLALPPFLRLLLTGVGVDLVPHPTQDVGRGLGGHDERLDHRWRQLAQDSAHGARHPALLVLPGGCVVDGQRCVCDALGSKTS